MMHKGIAKISSGKRGITAISQGYCLQKNSYTCPAGARAHTSAERTLAFLRVSSKLRGSTESNDSNFRNSKKLLARNFHLI